jgi:hypothetical protein
VTQLAFAPSVEKGEEYGVKLLSVSRDRSWALHLLTIHQQGEMELVVTRLAGSGNSPLSWTFLQF